MPYPIPAPLLGLMRAKPTTQPEPIENPTLPPSPKMFTEVSKEPTPNPDAYHNAQRINLTDSKWPIEGEVAVYPTHPEDNYVAPGYLARATEGPLTSMQQDADSLLKEFYSRLQWKQKEEEALQAERKRRINEIPFKTN